VETARNLTAKEDLPLTIAHYLKNMGRLADQYFENPDNYRDKNRQRVYLKDIDCPPVWSDKLQDCIPGGLYYLNESTGDIGGAGAVEEPVPGTSAYRPGRGIARAGDLMSNLPPEMRAENLMCYIGHEGTYTPAHREMCASLGQNIMVEASGAVGDDGRQEKYGSSVWFMTETKDRHMVAEYWLSVLGHDIEVESHFGQIQAWVHAPFQTYVVEQRPGDFILIPPLAPHQVWNRGTRTMKVAWNRTTVETLEMALNEALPNARLVCRDEQYKNKAIVYYSLVKYSGLLKRAKAQREASPQAAEAIRKSSRIRHLQRDFKRLFDLYKLILLSEMFSQDGPKEYPEFIAYDSNITCAYCRGNIFNRFLTCKSCIRALGTETDEPYDVCMDCYAMGRSCSCISGHTWVEQWKYKDLLNYYEEWRYQIMDIDGSITDKTPLSIQEERRYYGKKTIAQICQEQLRLRPWVNINEPHKEDSDSEDVEIVVNDDGTVKKLTKKRSKAWYNKHKSCHVCFHRHPTWKMAQCTNCDLWYCYGTLFRAHDLMPQTIMEDLSWKCPHCRRVCNTGACRRDPRQKPYEPKGTILGHDTKKVADARSTEALVDFSVSNISWLRDGMATPLESSRLKRRREQAEREKQFDPTQDERFVDEPIERPPGAPEDITYENSQPIDGTSISQDHDDCVIDPVLRGDSGFSTATPFTPINVRVANDVNTNGTDARHEPNSPSAYPPVPSSAPYHAPETAHPGADALQVPNPSKRSRETDTDPVKPVSSKRRKKDQDKDGEDQLARSSHTTAAIEKYRKEQEKKQLEDARKQGRFIIVWATMKKKSNTIKLSISSARLAAVQSRKTDNQPNSRSSEQDDAHQSTIPEAAVILQSDVTLSQGRAPVKRVAKSKQSSSQLRSWVKDAEDFRSRKRKSVRGRNTTYTEQHAYSDEEDFSDEVLPQKFISGSERRRSNWLRRNGNDENIPTELPPNFKEGQVNSRSRRASQPQRPRAQICPSGSKQNRASTGNRNSTSFVRDTVTATAAAAAVVLD
jgi:hypothetical protein